LPKERLRTTAMRFPSRANRLASCLILLSSRTLQAQIPNPPTARPRSRIIADIRESRTVALRGNRHPLLNTALDLSVAPSNYQMHQMVLHLKSDAAQQSALEALITAQHDKKSALYHQWLTPEEFGSRFGVAQADF